MQMNRLAMDDGRSTQETSASRTSSRCGASGTEPSSCCSILSSQHREPALAAGHRRRDVGHLGDISLERVAGDDGAGHGDRLERRAVDGIRRG